MEYSEALDFIHGIARFGSKPGLRRVSMLLERMGGPQDKLKFIHVAGTNGKGSTSAMLSRILSHAGYKTGLYISPFILDFRERIQADNEMISETDLANSTALVKSHWDALDALGETPTEFEVVVAVAMDYFLKQGCDIVILEVGMGGRFDATNVIKTPVCSVITSIGIDHTEYLGPTITDIAREKCGIIKQNGITVCYPRQTDEAMRVIEKSCTEKNNRLLIAGDAKTVSADIGGSRIIYGGLEIFVPLAGGHQVFNAATAVEAVNAARIRGFDISDEDVVSGISLTSFPSRLEILSSKPYLVLLDGAHNLSGAAALSESLKLVGERKIHAIAGFSSDKDVDGMLKLILPRCDSVTACRSANSRAMPEDQIARTARRYCGNVYVAETVETALRETFSRCGQGGAVLIFGSLYFASDIRPAAKKILETFG